MCTPFSSSLLASQMKELGMHNGPIDYGLTRDAKDKILEIFRLSKNLTAVYLLGGEPFSNDFHDEILDVLVNHPNKSNIMIHYNTNMQGSKYTKYLDKFNGFKLIDMQASIDGSDEVYDYIRWPGKWTKLVRNLQKTLEVGGNIKTGACVTVQALNAENIPKLVNSLFEINKGTFPLFFIPITGDCQLNLAPKRVLEQAIKDVEAIQFEHKQTKHNLITMYKEALDNEPDIRVIETFFRKQKSFDSFRNQNLFDTLPYMLESAERWGIETW